LQGGAVLQLRTVGAGPRPMCLLTAATQPAFDCPNCSGHWTAALLKSVATMNEPPILEGVGLRKVFGEGQRGRERIAVAGCDVRIAAGESLGIVGESGSGKTTLAHMLVGLEQPSGGQVYADGHAVPSRPTTKVRQELARRVQLVFQDPYSSLDPRQTVRGCIDEAAKLHLGLKKSQRHAYVDTVMQSVGLEPALGRVRPRRLSGGQRQRVAIARALACEPSLLILDEAVAA